MAGKAEIYGLDGNLVYRSMNNRDQGTKTAATTWTLKDAIVLPSLLDDRQFDHVEDNRRHGHEGDR